jgi:hypothetical protein
MTFVVVIAALVAMSGLRTVPLVVPRAILPAVTGSAAPAHRSPLRPTQTVRSPDNGLTMRARDPPHTPARMSIKLPATLVPLAQDTY